MDTADSNSTVECFVNNLKIIISKTDTNLSNNWTVSVPAIHLIMSGSSRHLTITRVKQYVKTIQPDIAFSVTTRKVDKLILFSHLVELARAAMQQRNTDAFYLRDLLISRLQTAKPYVNVSKLLQIGHDLVLGAESVEADFFRSLSVGRNLERSTSVTTHG